MGEDLLSIKQALVKRPDEAQLEELRGRLRRNVFCFMDDAMIQSSDELTVLLKIARSLDVRVEIDGEPPETDPLRHLVTTGLHECLTNLLRHAHGDLLRLELKEERDQLIVVYSGNGDPPTEPVREIGGLRTLREMTESLGGTMTVSAEPTLRVTLSLPKSKEDPYGL